PDRVRRPRRYEPGRTAAPLRAIRRRTHVRAGQRRGAPRTAASTAATCPRHHGLVQESVTGMLQMVLALLLGAASPAQPERPPVTEGDFVLRNFRFASGEVLPELRLHYRTLGQPRKDARGRVRNAV